jgi:urease accessory protein
MSLVTIELLDDRDPPAGGGRVIELPMTAEDRRRVRRRIQAPDGTEFALCLPTGTRLMPGQVLHSEHERRYVVVAAAEDVIVIHPRDKTEAAKVGHLVGNLHRDIDCVEGVVTVLWDEPLHDRLDREGFVLERDRRPFLGNPTSGHSH